MKHSQFIVVAIGMVAVPAKTSGSEDGKAGSLGIAIIVPKNDSGVQTIDRGGEFQVVFTNRSNEVIRLWSETCEPGHNTLSFHIEYADGSTAQMHERSFPAASWRNTPLKTITVSPGGRIRWDVRPSDIWGERLWQGVPEPNTGKPVEFTAVFEIKATDAAKLHGVWTGRITSQPIRVMVVDPNLKTPHDYLWADCPKQAVKLMQADPTWIHKQDEDQCMPLHLASRFGFFDVARWLLAHGADVNATAYNDFTPLHCAEVPRMIQLLVDHGANVNAKHTGGRTVLEEAAGSYAYLQGKERFARAAEESMRITQVLRRAGAHYSVLSACYLGDLERVRTLIVDKKQARDRDAMVAAARHGRAHIVRLLLEHGADPSGAQFGRLPVSYFAIEHPEVLKLLLEAGADPSVRFNKRGSGYGQQGWSLLNLAADQGIIQSAKHLLARGVDINCTNVLGYTPLHFACGRGHAEMAQWLLENKADANARSKNGWTPMSLAAYQYPRNLDEPENTDYKPRFRAVISLLERAGVEVDIFAAISLNDAMRVAKILEADPIAGAARDPAGNPALNRAAAFNCTEIVRLLLENGSDPNLQSRTQIEWIENANRTALGEAAYLGHFEIAEMLIKAGANVNARFSNGDTALHYAAVNRHAKVVRLLLASGADVNAKNSNGATPLDWIDDPDGSPAIIKLLRDHGGM